MASSWRERGDGWRGRRVIEGRRKTGQGDNVCHHIFF